MTNLLQSMWELIKFIPDTINTIINGITNFFSFMPDDLKLPLLSVLGIIIIVFIYKFVK